MQACGEVMNMIGQYGHELYSNVLWGKDGSPFSSCFIIT